MPLPQQVIDQITREPSKTPGWFSSVVLFSGLLFAFTLVIYFGMVLAYEPYLTKSIASQQDQIAKLGQSISSSDEAGLITYYSGMVNLRSLLDKHVAFSQFFAWLEKNTEANVHYSQFSFSSVSGVSFTGSARTQQDVTQQIAIFESSPEVAKVVISNVSLVGANGTWQFSANLIMNPSVFASPYLVVASANTSGTSATSTP
jgi:hypothetical protein